MEKKPVYYLTPALLTIIIFASDFLSTDLFKAGYQNFSVWFVLSIFSFACGWLMNKTLGYNHGGKVVFAVIVASTFISVLMISIFSGYFGLSDLLVENLILYVLRNIMLGAMAFFGMALSEIIILQKENSPAKTKEDDSKKIIENAQREANLLIEEAKLKSDKMIYQVQQGMNDMIERKNQIERRLKEFIAAERELIKKYESDED
ncbi:MAG: hypothetical protein CVV24_13515 [Ignavibacteriae bacterium HGW-Ignavibacteriae-3]|nr:MAG: hypothetical protein CVV24_13515 [Ignavibacteriae bacterium HGW-Ignavibacteriae-3]